MDPINLLMPIVHMSRVMDPIHLLIQVSCSYEH